MGVVLDAELVRDRQQQRVGGLDCRVAGVRAELVDVERALKLVATEIVRLRRANEDLADKVAKLTRR